MTAKKQKPVLGRDAILAAAKNRKTRDVEIERLGGSIRIREMSTAEMMAYRKEVAEMDNAEAGMHLVARCWVDEDGALLFSGESALADLGSLPMEVLNEVSTAVVEVNGIGDKAEQEAGKD